MRRNVRLQCPQGHMLRELRPAGTCWAAHECRGWGPWGGLFQVRGQALLLFLSDLFLSLQVTDPTAGPHHDLIQPSAALRAPPTPTQRVHLGNFLSRPAGSCTTTPPTSRPAFESQVFQNKNSKGKGMKKYLRRY